LKYTKLSSALALLLFVGFASCQKDDFVEIPGVCPAILFSNPLNGATNVPLDQIIRAAFNEKILPASVNRFSFIVQGSALINGVVTYIDSTAYFSPNTPLSPNTTYMARLTRLITDLSGNTLQSDYIWTFSTGAVLAPMVISTNPANNAVGVVNTQAITAAFSLPMDVFTINAATFLVKRGVIPVAGVLSYTGNLATFTPLEPLLAGTTYTVNITTGVQSIAGIALPNNFLWAFTTQAK
jgi:Bacterial Ig-like domain